MFVTLSSGSNKVNNLVKDKEACNWETENIYL